MMGLFFEFFIFIFFIIGCRTLGLVVISVALFCFAVGLM